MKEPCYYIIVNHYRDIKTGEEYERACAGRTFKEAAERAIQCAVIDETNLGKLLVLRTVGYRGVKENEHTTSEDNHKETQGM